MGIAKIIMGKIYFKIDKVMVRNLINIQIVLWLLLCTSSSFAQSEWINGYVYDDAGQPIGGALVTLVENPSVFTKSNKDGFYTINAENGQHLNVTKHSMAGGVVPVTGTVMNLKLTNDNSAIHVGYGQLRSRDELTGAIGIATSDQLSSSFQINPENTLYGKIPGLMVLQNGGGPPTEPTFFIRGRETFNNSNILVLIDGFERPLSSISTAEIQNVTVLKDAGALAIYGQRGANGVLLVNTKRGDIGKLIVNASVEQGFTQATALPEFLDASLYARAINEARSNDGRPSRYSQSDLAGFDSGLSPYLYPNVNWFDEVLRDYGSQNNFKLTFRGGDQRARYFVATNYAQDYGIFNPGDFSSDYSSQRKYKQFNFRSNIDINLTDNLLFKTNVGTKIFDSNIPTGNNFDGIFNALYNTPSAAFPVRTPDNRWGGSQIYGNNPKALLTSTGYGNPNGRELFLDGSLRQSVTSELAVEVAASFSSLGTYMDREIKEFSYVAINPIMDDQGNIVDTTLTTFGQDTDLVFSNSIGQMRRQSNFMAKAEYAKVFDNSVLKAMALVHQDARVLRGQDNTFNRMNYASNIHYGLDGKYFFDLSASYSGINILPPGEKFNFFPAIAAGWIISRESFIDETGIINYLKLRTSWGLSGNDLLPANNPYEQSYNTASGYWFGNANIINGGIAEGQMASSSFTVETSNKVNVGLDGTFFEKLDISADIFYARRTNILTGTNGRVSNIIGMSQALETDGIVDNKGLETSISWADRIGEVSYHIGGQFTFARNKIIEMNEPFTPYSNLRRTGRPIGQNFGLVSIGFFKDEDDINNSPRQLFSEVRPGDIKYKDQNGDGIINEFDEIALGYSSAHPEIYFSAIMGLNYKGFAISALFQGTANHTAYLNTQSVYWPLQNNNTISTLYYDNRWTPETAETARFPRLTLEGNENNFRSNDIWLRDMSYIKLRTLEVSYTLPVTISTRLNMNRVRFYAQGQNLFSIDTMDILDPESIAVGYPILRSYNIGMEIEF